MTPRDHAPDDERALAAFREAARVTTPSPFETVRAGRDLDDALDREVAASRRWTPGRVAAVATAAACAGVAVAIAVVAPSLQPAHPRLADVVQPVVAHPVVVVATAPVVDAAPVVVAPPTLDVAAGTLHEQGMGAPKDPMETAPRRPRTWRTDAERLVEKGDGVGAARVLVRALATDESAASALALVARRFPAALDAVDAELARLEGAEAMRLRCEQRLLHARDAVAVEACRGFAQKHPQHPGARALSYAAGRVAEDLGDLALAEEEYSRALLLSPFVGLPSMDALLSRARVRADRGDVEEARADLRLYLHNEPGAARDETVRALAERLRLPTP